MRHQRLTIIFITVLLCGTVARDVKAQSYRDVGVAKERAMNRTKYLDFGADRLPEQSPEYLAAIDSAISHDPTDALLWYCRAFPFVHSYKLYRALPLIDTAVKYDPVQYLPYKGLVLCLYAHNYRAALQVLNEAERKNPGGLLFGQDYLYYIGLAKLQLEDYSGALAVFDAILERDKHRISIINGPFHRIYKGIALLELHRDKEALHEFDSTLAMRKDFRDAMYYKAIGHQRLGMVHEAMESISKAEDLYGTFNEDDAMFVRFPYQVTSREIRILASRMSPERIPSR